jgi:ABC-type bacteriocin/lantibiotic exporter with double-glycine peptidase domain
VRKGDFIGISGASGKGKTTLINLCLGFLKPNKGAIYINDAVVSGDDLKRYWPKIAYVRQQPFFIHDTIEKNITLEEKGFDEGKMLHAVDIAGLWDLIGSDSNDIHKIITENGKNISGGQQQRIAIARALYKDAELILLDEPFNELDEASESLFLHHFRQLAQDGKTILMITHNKKAFSFCNKIVSLDE